MSEFEIFPPPMYSSSFSPIPDDLNFNYPMPLTPSDFGSADEQMYSPRTTMAMPIQHSVPEKTHATSGVSWSLSEYNLMHIPDFTCREEEHKIVQPNVRFVSARKSTHEIWRSNLTNSRRSIEVSRRHMLNSLPHTTSSRRRSACSLKKKRRKGVTAAPRLYANSSVSCMER
jgi:hypothetical protein